MSKNMLIFGGVFVFIGLLAYGISYRFVEQNAPKEENSRVQIVASFYPLAHIAQQIGKERVEVLNLTPAGSEPHDFDPSPRDVAVLQNAKIFIYNGVGLEPWVPALIPELEQKGVRVLEASKGLSLLSGKEHEDEHEESEDEAFDPHVWLDPVLVKEQVNAIASMLVVVDSAHATEYLENARMYTQDLEALHQEFMSGLATCARREIITSHAAFAYLAKRYTLNMVPIAGFSPDEEPTPARLAEISTFVKERGVTHIFFETLVSPKLAETIARETGAKTIALHPLEGLSNEEISAGKTYISVQRENVQALKSALGCV